MINIYVVKGKVAVGRVRLKATDNTKDLVLLSKSGLPVKVQVTNKNVENNESSTE